MRKYLYTLLIAALALAVSAPAVIAQGNGNGNDNGNGNAGNSHVVHVNMAPDPKDEEHGDADIDPDATGRITVHVVEPEEEEDEYTFGKFVFNGKNLTPGATYELRSGGNIIADGVANGGGNVHISGEYDGDIGPMINLWNLEDDDTRVLRGDLP